MRYYFILLTVILFFFSGCRSEEQPIVVPVDKTKAVITPDRPLGCSGCHSTIQLDPAHPIACTSCHSGNDSETTKEAAHVGLVGQPGHPDTMKTSCGGCHSESLDSFAHSLHASLRNKINQVRSHFGAQKTLGSLLEIPQAPASSSPLALADDMLRRRCLRCHTYTSGDNYPSVARGTGCAACHLTRINGKLQSHSFRRPSDSNCLSCHYGNYVGNDYYGRYENDFNWEYRTPYTTKEDYARPYGVELHDLAPDIHQQQGLECIDCHDSSGHSTTNQNRLTCFTCHGWTASSSLPPVKSLSLDDTTLVLTTRSTNTKHRVPPLQHPAHSLYANKVDCQVCHAQWSFNDASTHLMLSETDEYDKWERLTVQSSSAVETLLDHNLYSNEEELDPAMRDGITGDPFPGIWYMGYTQRRWEDMIIRRDTDGIIKIFRPLLDLRLSMVDDEENVIYDNLTGSSPVLRPYTPHTTGHAGMFYKERFNHLITEKDQQERRP